MSFSDFSILPGLRKKQDLSILDKICQLSLAFLDDRLNEVLKEEIPTTEMKFEIIGAKPDGTPRKKLIGNVGDVAVS